MRGDLRPDFPFSFAVNNLEYDFQKDKSGFLTEISVTVCVPDRGDWPKITPLSGPGPVLNIQASSPHLPLIRQHLRVIEGLLTPYGMHSLNLSEPEQKWIPESADEKAQLSIYSYQVHGSHLPRGETAAVPFSLVVSSVVAAEQAAPFELALSFLRKGYVDMQEWGYIEAIYDFYFMLERLYGNGKTKNADVQREFQASPTLVTCIRTTLNDPANIEFFLSDPGCATVFRTKYQGKAPEEIIASMIKLRGFLHHQSSKRGENWHPEDQELYKTEALLFQMICLEVFYAITNPLLFSRETKEIGEKLWEHHRSTSPPPATSPQPDNLPPRAISPETRDKMQKRLEDFFQAFGEGRSATLILTTDGTHYTIRDSLYPLPPRYLKQWDEDTRSSDFDSTWGD